MGNDNRGNKEETSKRQTPFTRLKRRVVEIRLVKWIFGSPFSRAEKWTYGVLFVFAILWCISSPLLHIYGPYKGKVVDLETGAPIEGAAVFVEFYTEGIFASSDYGGATETMTDEDGEFSIFWRPVLSFRPVSKWETHGYVTIFKPGYGAYPGHDDSKPLFKPNGTIPEKERVTIRLPKLKSIEERQNNLMNISIGMDVPERKCKKIVKLVKQEQINVGLR